MSFKSVLLASALLGAAAGPTPPCSAPPGIVPVLPEGLCYNELVPVNPSGISIRQYGFPGNASFVTASVGPQSPYLQGVQGSIASALNYFSGQNDEQRNILSARIVPFAINPPGPSNGAWSANIGISTLAFPDDFLIPRPNPRSGVSVVRLAAAPRCSVACAAHPPFPPTHTQSLVSSNINLIASFAFNTTGFPYLENFQEACGVIQNSTLPPGYAVNTTNAWSPTYVFCAYGARLGDLAASTPHSPHCPPLLKDNGMAAVNFTSECWMAVYKL